jgi:hypothetical protein
MQNTLCMIPFLDENLICFCKVGSMLDQHLEVLHHNVLCHENEHDWTFRHYAVLTCY